MRLPLPALDLRPLSTADLLNRALSLYRARMGSFLAVAWPPALLSLATGLLRQFVLPPHVANSGARSQIDASTLLFLAAAVLVLTAYGLVQAATTRLVLQLSLGHEADPRGAFTAIQPRLSCFIGVELWKGWSLVWLPLVLSAALLDFLVLAENILRIAIIAAALLYGFVAYLRNSLSIPAAVLEDLPTRAAMRRSKQLAHGFLLRLLQLYLVLALLFAVSFMVRTPFFLLAYAAKAPLQHTVALVLEQLLSAAFSLLITPVASIALCLFYLDARVRRDSLTLDQLRR